MRRTTSLARTALIFLVFGTWSLASCAFLAGDGGGPAGGPGVPGAPPSPLPALGFPLSTLRVSSLPPVEADSDSYASVLSRDGQWVAFTSYATNLVGGDTNFQQDIFVTSVATGVTTRVSVSTGGTQVDNYTYQPIISANGRHVVFASYSNLLVASDFNGTSDVFVRDRDTDNDLAYDEAGNVATVRVSVDSNGAEAAGDCTPMGVSDDGRYVVFYSYAGNLVAGDFNGTYDIFVHDRDFDDDGIFDETGLGDRATVRVSVDSDGLEANSSSFGFGNSISSNGRYVAFYSYASNLVSGDFNNASDVFVHDRDADGNGTFDEAGLGERSTTRMTVDANGAESNDYTYSATISGDGQQVMFYTYASNLVPGDTNFRPDVYARAVANPTTIRRISVSTAGAQGDSESYGWSLSTTGRYVVFYSYSANLVPGDPGFPFDAFLRDRDTDGNGTFDEPGLVSTTRLSLDSFGNPGNSDSYEPSISGDGSRVTFQSYASNLVLGDSNFRTDIFVRDVPTSATRRVSQGLQPGGNLTSLDPSVDASGLIVAFTSSASNLVPSDAGGFTDVFVRDVTGGPCTLVSVSSTGAQGTNHSGRPSQSANGRFVAFESVAANLVVGDGNAVSDIFVRDLAFGLTTRVSISSLGAEGNGGSFRPSISGDGRFVVFDSTASNLVPSDGNGQSDIFVHDRLTGITTRVSVDSAGTEAAGGASSNATISSDGRIVAFASLATNLVVPDANAAIDVFVHDRVTEATTRVSVDSAGAEANGGSGLGIPTLSSDGRFVAFESIATNLVAGDANGFFDIFVHDRTTGATRRISVDSAGLEADNHSIRPSISEDGRFVAFESLATNLVANDTNSLFDIFRHDRTTGATVRVNISSQGAQSVGGICGFSAISADGRFVAFQCSATNLSSDDTEGVTDIYLRGPLP